MSKLIGLGGALRAGKDAVAEHLSSEHGYVTLGMSDALNEALLTLNPWIPVVVDTEYSHGTYHYRYADLHDAVGYVEAKKNSEVRRLLQVLGTEVGRKMIDEDVWVQIAEDKIRGLLAEDKSVVITAIRFPNEIEMLKRLGGHSVWIERDAVSRFKGLNSAKGVDTPEKGSSGVSEAPVSAESTIKGHESENSVNKGMFEYSLDNNGTLEELYLKTDKLLESFGVDELLDAFGVDDTPHWAYTSAVAGGEPYVRYEYGGK